MSTVIKIENLGKRYRVRNQAGYINLKEVLSRQFARLTSSGDGEPSHREHWALREVNVEIGSGELLGLVGLNGSGKSTLLKLLSEVTKPTTGTIKLWGRIGSLLEVGTGFHPELTGRENIYLSGSILGMSSKDITRKFEEIVAFSEMEPYLNMPVKRYSSGMYMRLAFSVAAHLDPDILLIDEALAVGDLNFRRKCMSKMQRFVQSGATVIFVSHNMGLLAETCHRCLFLEKGLLIEDGPAASVIQRYLKSANSRADIFFPSSLSSSSSDFFSWLRINRGQPATCGEPFELEVALKKSPTGTNFFVGFGFCSVDGTRLLSCEGNTLTIPVGSQALDAATFHGVVANLPLAPGIYLLDLVLRDSLNQIVDFRPACAQVEIISDEKNSQFFLPDVGGVRIPCVWEN